MRASPIRRGSAREAGYIKWLSSSGFEIGVISFWLGLDRGWVGQVVRGRVMRRVPSARPGLAAYKHPPHWVLHAGETARQAAPAVASRARP
jgi:hypothetical protein